MNSGFNRVDPGVKRLIPGLGAKVQGIRERLGLSQQVVAVRGGTTPGTIIQLERYDLATTRTLGCISKALGVSVDELTERRPLKVVA